MKKDILLFIFKTIVIVSVFGITAFFLPQIIGALNYFNSEVVTVFAPLSVIEDISFKDKQNNSNNADNIKTTDNNTNTTKAESQLAENIDKKDGDLYSDITATPADIEKLMKQAEKNIGKEKKKGKTSEEDYFGGGELLTFDSVEIQSKIPSSFYKPNIKALLNQKAELKIMDKSKPTILIYHSHTTESYTLLDVGYYTESLDPRSKDKAKNMVRVGDDLAAYLELKGFKVIHDRNIYDDEYNSAYSKSRKAVEKYLEEYPSIEITIDVHRDDITYKDKTKVKPTAVINGKKAARLMIIAGAEYGSIENYPDWEYNLRFALAVQNKVNKMYSGLMRPILFSQRKYNMDETRNSFLLEVGTDANTLDEACYSARLFANALAQMLDEEYVKVNDKD